MDRGNTGSSLKRSWLMLTHAYREAMTHAYREAMTHAYREAMTHAYREDMTHGFMISAPRLRPTRTMRQ